MNLLKTIEWLLAATRGNVKSVKVDPQTQRGVISTAQLDYQVEQDKDGRVVVGKTIALDSLDEAQRWID